METVKVINHSGKRVLYTHTLEKDLTNEDFMLYSNVFKITDDTHLKEVSKLFREFYKNEFDLELKLLNKSFGLENILTEESNLDFLTKLMIDDYLSIADNTILVYYKDGIIKGTLFYSNYLNKYDDYDKEIRVTVFYVDEKYRNQGIGSMLLSSALKFAKERNYKKMTTVIVANNPFIELFTKKFKFKIIKSKFASMKC